MKHSIKHYLFKLKWIVAIGVFVVFTGFVGEHCWVKRMIQKQEIADLKGEIDEYNRKFEADKKLLERIRNDADVMADVARQRYLMKKPNEDIYIFEAEEN